MKFEQTMYHANDYYPRPEIVYEKDLGLLFIATPWGERNLAQKSLNLIKDNYLSSFDDLDVTSPFAKLSCLSSMANNLRSAIRLTNDNIYHEDNREEYTNAIELLCIAKNKLTLSLAQVGGINVYIYKNKKYYPLSVSPTLNLETFSSEKKKIDPYLPNKLIGLHSTTDITFSTVKVSKQDKLVFIARPYINESLFRNTLCDISHLKNSIVNEDCNQSFWLATLDFS